MSWNKIFALSLRHIYLIKGSFPRILDLIYWPTIQILLWGFISKFFTLNSTFYENTVGISLSIRKEILKRRNITKYSNVRYPSPSMDEDDKKELEFILKDYL